MLNLKILLPAFILLFSLTACIDYNDVEFLGIEDYGFDKVSKDEINIRISVKVENPNTYNIKVKKSKFDILLNGKKLGQAVMKNDIVLKKNATDVYDIVMKSDYQEISKGLLSSIGVLMGGKTKLRIVGKAKAKAFGIGKKFDVDFEQDIKASDFNLF